MVVFRWLVGFAIGTAMVALTSPWFVRSYVPRVEDAYRKVPVLQPNSNYRWRSEGYATTRIGPLGMPGQASMLPNQSGAVRIALWGDSQAEGVCVDDDQKIAALTSAAIDSPCVVMPFARSGDDCNDWIHQVAAIEDSSAPWLSIDAHVFLLVEWSDWCVDVDPADVSIDQSFNQLSRTLPAFIVQAARNALTIDETNRIRPLRFHPGPVPKHSNSVPLDAAIDASDSSDRLEKLASQLRRLRNETKVPCIFLYAPLIPAIAGGKLNLQDEDEPMFAVFQDLCRGHGFQVADLRHAMAQSVSGGSWPRGFQNGQFGVGHYNGVGNQIIAQHIARKVKRIGLQD